MNGGNHSLLPLHSGAVGGALGDTGIMGGEGSHSHKLSFLILSTILRKALLSPFYR